MLSKPASPPCCFTSQRSSRNVPKPNGFCAMTRLAYGRGRPDDRPPPHTYCNHCKQYACCACWDGLADDLDKHLKEHPTVAVEEHQVWELYRVRIWRRRADDAPGWRAADGDDGGTWLEMCPCCLLQKLPAYGTLTPRTLSGAAYAPMQPKLLQRWHGLIEAVTVNPDGSNGPLRRHTVELLVFSQLVGDDEARFAFKCARPLYHASYCLTHNACHTFTCHTFTCIALG